MEGVMTTLYGENANFIALKVQRSGQSSVGVH